MLCQTDQIIDCCLNEAIAEDAERRRLSRKPFFRQATISVPSESPVTMSAFCRDISRSGIGLLHESPVETGTHFTVAIPMIGCILELHCAMAWCSCVGENLYVSGSAYECASTPQSLFLMSAIVSGQLHRRLQRRFPFFRAVTLEDDLGDQTPAFCRDISRRGIGLVHRDPIARGHVIVTIPSPDREDTIAIANIERCRPTDNGWYSSGGEFLIDRCEDQPRQSTEDAPAGK